MGSDGVSHEVMPWGETNDGGGILKTIDVHIVRSQLTSGEDKPRSSSVEKLVG
jgi:hypothetical protein